jgi:hypothetical protein
MRGVIIVKVAGSITETQEEREAEGRKAPPPRNRQSSLPVTSLHSLAARLHVQHSTHDSRRLVTTRPNSALCNPLQDWKTSHWGEWTKSPTSSRATKATHKHHRELRQLIITRPRTRPTRPPRHCPPWRRYTATTSIRTSST